MSPFEPEVALPPIDEAKLVDVATKLQNQIGMAGVKEAFNELIAGAVVDRQRLEQGLPVSDSTHHLVFTGGPGTGKTTVARMIAQGYHALGILPTDKVVEVDRSKLVGGYLGQSALKTAEVFESARGGVLFIDEAYTLGKDDYGREAVDTLIPLMENHRDDTVVIVAGYPKEMQSFLDANSGLRSRFSASVPFEDYSPKEKGRILDQMLDDQLFVAAAPETRRAVNAALEAVHAESNGNARDVRNLMQAMKTAHDVRVAGDPTARLNVLTPEDVEAGLARVRTMFASKPTGRAPRKAVPVKAAPPKRVARRVKPVEPVPQ